MTLEKLWNVLEALELGETLAQCGCGAVSPDPEFCRQCGALDLERFELEGLRDVLAGEFRRALAARHDRTGPDRCRWAALAPSVN
jgi:hypothetical protein